MKPSTKSASVEDILPWRDLYRQEMACQVVHDSLHRRPGWTREYFLQADGVNVGYGSVVLGGPWNGIPSAFEFYVLPQNRSRMFDLFSEFLSASGAVNIEAQTNDPLLTVMLHTFTNTIVSESILFHDRLTTTHAPSGAVFRRATAVEAPDVAPPQLDSHGVVEVEGTVAASGGILFHYNRPYGDIFMEVAEPFRRRGLGSFIVQELKRVCYAQGSVPSARCNPKNVASRKTLQKAGFVPCGLILKGSVAA